MDIVSVLGYWYPASPGIDYFPDWVVNGDGIDDWVVVQSELGTWVGEPTPAVSDRWTTLPVLFLLFGALVSFRQTTIKSLL